MSRKETFETKNAVLDGCCTKGYKWVGWDGKGWDDMGWDGMGWEISGRGHAKNPL